MKKIILSLSLLVAIASQASDFDADKYLDQSCSTSYKQIDNFLQYLYKADGNLGDLNSSKIKRIEYLEGVFSDGSTSDAHRLKAKEAFNELFYDPDWYVFKLQRNTRKLIGKLEKFKEEYNWVNFKKLAMQQAERESKVNLFLPSATRSMRQTLQLIDETSNFFTDRSEVKGRLDELGAASRMSRAFNKDAGKDSFESTLFALLPSRLLGCQIDHLESRLDTKK